MEHAFMGRCGILCSNCPAFRATGEGDAELRKKTAVIWSKIYNMPISPDGISCRGCRSDDHFFYCDVCKIRACCIRKGLDNCGLCSEFPCNLERVVTDHSPGILKRLSGIE